MKTLARFCVYVAGMAVAVILLLQPVAQFVKTGDLDLVTTLMYLTGGFGMVFVATELSDALKRRWQQ